MNEFYKKTLFVADIYVKKLKEKIVNNKECKLSYHYVLLGKGIFTKSKRGYKSIVLNKYIKHPSPRDKMKYTINEEPVTYVINEESVERLEAYLKNFPHLNTKHKNHFSYEEIVMLESEFIKSSTKQDDALIK